MNRTMTNVPQPIRDAWADVYTLFDVSFKMSNDDRDWQDYWGRANELVKKYGDDIPLLEMFTAVAHMLEHFIKQREKPKEKPNESLPWKPDEDYPYPKD